jgi:hypothetical protein
MPLYLVLPILIAISYVAVNLGSRNKVPFVKIALPVVVVCVIVYSASSLLGPLFHELMQLWAHLQLP